MSERIGQRLGNYQLLQLIGRGHFTDVYLGEHLHLGTQAAIKVLHSRLTPEESDKLRSEARTMARLAHPHIIRVLEFGVEEGPPFLVMEYAPGGTLRQRHPKGSRIPLDLVVSYVKHVAEALQYIHTQKLIHRDVKPESMLLGRHNEVLLAEFGMAIIAQSTRSQQTQHTQEAAGSVAYMAPEQLTGKPRPASDQYALAVVAYEWLSGDPPFTGSVQQIARQHLSANPPPLRTKLPAITPAVEQVVMQALDKDPRQRFTRVADFALALQEAFDAEATGRTLFVPASGRTAEREQSPSASRHPPTGTVTLLFTDLDESTGLLQQSRDSYGSLLAAYRQVLQAAVQEWNGYEVESRGETVLAAFARATDAVAAALEVQRALAGRFWPEGVTVHARMGLHTGEPTLTADGYVGLDVHRAARIMSAGYAGQVLLSQTTAHLVEQDLPDNVNLRDLGEYRLKDLGRPKHLFQLDIAGLPVDFPPLQTLDSYPHNLPVQLTPFIGREQEVSAVCSLLRREEVHLLALTGPGGTGKTRLALQAAAELSDHFADGVFFVNLAPISDPALVLPAIAETLGIREGAEQSLLERLQGHLRQKQMLLLLDNFEQVVSAAVRVVDLLVACPQLKVMVTSREVPHVRAKHEFIVPPLPLPDLKHLPDLATLSHFAAVALFISRAQAVKADFQMTATNAQAIAEICARLDGLPLAIELAAARIKLLLPQALLTRLSQRLGVLTSEALDVPERQQTLRNTIAWSYQLLDAKAQRLFRSLSVFVGGCTLEAIEAVCAGMTDEAESMLDAVASLIDKSLLHQTEQESAAPRFVMLETLREFGREALTLKGEVEATRQAHAVYYVALAEAAESAWEGPQEPVWFMRLEQEHDNLRAALGWLLERGEAEMALRLGAALRWFWNESGFYHEGWNALESALQGSEQVAVPVRAKALWAAGSLVLWLGHFERGEALCQESLALFRSIRDAEGMATAMFHLGMAAESKGGFAAARSRYEESLVLSRGAGNTIVVAWTLRAQAEVAILQGEYARARPLLEESLALFSELDNKSGTCYSLLWLALLLFWQGDLGQAYTVTEECLLLYREIGRRSAESKRLPMREEMTFYQDATRSRSFLARRTSALLAEMTFYQGDTPTARLLLEKGRAFYREGGDEAQLASTLSLLARVMAAQGDDAAARECYEESLKRGKGSHFTLSFLDIPPALEGLAAVVAVQGEASWAARLWGAAEAEREAYRTPLAPIYRADYERAVADARTQLGVKAFAAAWAQGRMMSLEQVLAAKGTAERPELIPTEPSSNLKEPMPSTFPAGLTAREMEVLRLLAQGLTSAQIAEQLTIGLVTVNSHVRSIYSKLEVTSRAAATRYALEHHLL